MKDDFLLYLIQALGRNGKFLSLPSERVMAKIISESDKESPLNQKQISVAKYWLKYDSFLDEQDDIIIFAFISIYEKPNETDIRFRQLVEQSNIRFVLISHHFDEVNESFQYRITTDEYNYESITLNYPIHQLPLYSSASIKDRDKANELLERFTSFLSSDEILGYLSERVFIDYVINDEKNGVMRGELYPGELLDFVYSHRDTYETLDELFEVADRQANEIVPNCDVLKTYYDLNLDTSKIIDIDILVRRGEDLFVIDVKQLNLNKQSSKRVNGHLKKAMLLLSSLGKKSVVKRRPMGTPNIRTAVIIQDKSASKTRRRTSNLEFLGPPLAEKCLCYLYKYSDFFFYNEGKHYPPDDHFKNYLKDEEDERIKEGKKEARLIGTLQNIDVSKIIDIVSPRENLDAMFESYESEYESSSVRNIRFEGMLNDEMSDELDGWESRGMSISPSPADFFNDYENYEDMFSEDEDD